MKNSSQVYFLIARFLLYIGAALVICSGSLHCSRKTSPYFGLNFDEDTDSDFDSDSERQTTEYIPVDTVSDYGTEEDSASTHATESDSTDQCFGSTSDCEEKETSEEHDTESDSEIFSESDSDSKKDSEPDTGMESDLDSDTETEESSDTDGNSDCPGLCQFTPISSSDLIAIVGTSGIFVDPSIESYLLCVDSDGDTGLKNGILPPTYNGWVRDNRFSCPVGKYCCRPKYADEVYCNDAGGTCKPTNNPGDGAGWCVFASSECVQIEKRNVK